MKEKYEALEVEVIEFEAEDVITASGCDAAAGALGYAVDDVVN